ncbi:hypothetical protein [Streptomyces curacoi]|uniref:Secreted protein n=1 Tax=Streptomyces curacoi TaxID=146536 RepID=A0A117P3B0_9ACTN|nr:hypothetical protein [Streptomyces curacoi]KUM72294.1 hypothetical protein AQI70_23620 [Streptomyces curacoi]
MFNGKKIAAVAGLLGGLAMTCLGVGQAYAAASPLACTTDAQGNTVCTQRLTGETTEGEGFVVRRSMSCQPTQPLTLPAPGLMNHGSIKIGPEITCASTSPDDSESSGSTEPRLGQLGLPI